MNQAIIQVAFLVFSAIASIFVATEIANGNYPLAAGALTVAIIPLVWMFVAKKLPLESIVLACLAAGYFVLGKGLTYLRFTSILFVGEVVLAFCLLMYLVSVQSGKFGLIPKSKMAVPLLALGIYSLFHLWFDFRTFGIMALRDSCMIYYTMFFFFSYQLAGSPNVVSFFGRFLLVMSPFFLFSDVVIAYFPGVVEALYGFGFRGVPLFFPHADASAKSVVGLLLMLFAVSSSSSKWRIWAIAASLLITGYFLVNSRGAIFVTLFCVAIFVAFAAPPRRLIFQVATAAASLLIATALILTGVFGSKIRESFVTQVEALNPFTLQRQGSSNASTAEWRMYWWKKIVRDVNVENPLFGFGFGEDIGGSFAREFFKISQASEEHSRTRGAHNAFFTILGRLGWIGAVLFLWVTGVQLWYFWRAAKASKAGLIPPIVMYFWGIVIAGFVVTFFQYTWEASYAAIPFWIFSGVAYAHLDRVLTVKATSRRRVPSPSPLPASIGSPVIVS